MQFIVDRSRQLGRTYGRELEATAVDIRSEVTRRRAEALVREEIAGPVRPMTERLAALREADLRRLRGE
ncbi:hypothetical protein [Sphingomonas gilva]|nr:hypothetical protein [Sphingomonas gilva]